MKINSIGITKNGALINIGSETEIDRQTVLNLIGNYTVEVFPTYDRNYATAENPKGELIGAGIMMVKAKKKK